MFLEVADEVGPPGVKTDWRRHVVPQNWTEFTAQDHQVWNLLYGRQVPYLGDRISRPFLTGLKALELGELGIPRLDLLSARLRQLTGWQLVSVRGIVPDDAFFAMLANRVFPIGNFIRPASSIDYLEEPDCFHDIFGHVPMLAHAPVARMMAALGRLGTQAMSAGLGEVLSRLYWHTAEFGLVREQGEIKILGAGLASSFGEARFALEADVSRPRFTLVDAARTAYRNDQFQPRYFVSDSLEQVSGELELVELDRLALLAG